MMGTVAEGDDDFSILEQTAAARLENDTQPLLQDQSMCNNGGDEDGDVMQNASYFALKKAFAALKVRLGEVEHENERLHRQVKQLESTSGDFSGPGAPRPELMPSINKAYEAYKEKCHESSQLKEQLGKVTQKWQTAESQLQQLSEQLSRGCTKCAVQQTAETADTAEGQTALSCSKCNAQQTATCSTHGIATSSPKCTNCDTALSCPKCAVQGTASSCPNGLEKLTLNQMEKFRKFTDPVPPMSDPGGSAPVSMASVLQEEMDQTRAEMVQLRSLVRTQYRALNRLLSTQPALAQSPGPASGTREGPSTIGDSDIGSLGVLEGAEWQPPSDSAHPPPDSGHPPHDNTYPPPDSADPMVGGHRVHPVQCTDEFARENRHANRNGESEDLMLFSTLGSRQTNQFGRTLNAGAGSIVGPRYPPTDGYHCIVGIPLPTGRPNRQPAAQTATLENRFRQLGANQCVQTPIQYQRNTEHVGRHDNVGSNVNIAQPEPPTVASQQPTTQVRQFAWLESGKDIPPQNIYTNQQGSSEPTPNNSHDLSPQVRGHDLPPQVRGHDLPPQVRGESGEWGGEVVVRGSPLEWDRECPMCQQVFPDDIPQDMFVQHVNAHFEEEEARDDGFELFQM